MVRRLLAHGVIICGTAATALAGADQASIDRSQKANTKTKVVYVHRSCYVLLSGSPFPQPCERLRSEPSTATPMTIIGELPKKMIRMQIVTTARNKIVTGLDL